MAPIRPRSNPGATQGVLHCGTLWSLLSFVAEPTMSQSEPAAAAVYPVPEAFAASARFRREDYDRDYAAVLPAGPPPIIATS